MRSAFNSSQISVQTFFAPGLLKAKFWRQIKSSTKLVHLCLPQLAFSFLPYKRSMYVGELNSSCDSVFKTRQSPQAGSPRISDLWNAMHGSTAQHCDYLTQAWNKDKCLFLTRMLELRDGRTSSDICCHLQNTAKQHFCSQSTQAQDHNIICLILSSPLLALSSTDSFARRRLEVEIEIEIYSQSGNSSKKRISCERRFFEQWLIMHYQFTWICRAGKKLEAALQEFSVDIRDKYVLDCGISTGGFTDCLLQNGAASVIGVDVGYGQVNFVLCNSALTPDLFSYCFCTLSFSYSKDLMNGTSNLHSWCPIYIKSLS